MIHSYDVCCEMKLANRADIVRDTSMCEFISRKANIRLFTHTEALERRGKAAIQATRKECTNRRHKLPIAQLPLPTHRA